jgi:hypothetical protein
MMRAAAGLRGSCWLRRAETHLLQHSKLRLCLIGQHVSKITVLGLVVGFAHTPERIRSSS